MATETTTATATRHRLLEGVLHRLARRADADEYVVRGGVLMRHWFRPAVRPAEDLDLVASFPFDAEDTTRRLLDVLADSFPDDVVFDLDGTHTEVIALDTGPGVRLFVSGMASGEEDDFHIDVTFGPIPTPSPVEMTLPTANGPVRVRACRPESVVGHKMQALYHRGRNGWRPKDLDDLRLLARVPMIDSDLRDAIAYYLADARASGPEARAIFAPDSWWGMKSSAARWLDFAVDPSRRGTPKDLSAVVAEVTGRLWPILEGLP